MFSGCRSQAKGSFRRVLICEKGLNVIYTASFLRHLWSAHINDRKRNLHLESQPRFPKIIERDAVNLLEDAASGSSSTEERTIRGRQLPGETKPQTLDAVVKAIQAPITGTLLEQDPGPQSHGKLPYKWSLSRSDVPAADNWQGRTTYRPLVDTLTKTPIARPSNLTEARTAYEIERDNIWKRKWRRRQTLQRWSKAGHLKKDAERIYHWEVPLTIVWDRYRPVSELRRRGRIFRFTHVGRDPGVNVTWVEDPSTWTKVKFDSYVHELASVKPLPSPVTEALNAGPGRKVEARSAWERGAVLYELMHRRMSYAFIEHEVCNRAIQFFLRNKMSREAQSILFLMEHLNLHIPPSTLNLFLRLAVHYNDLAAFSRTLHIMRDRGIRRDSETLMLLLWCLRSRKRKSAVIKRMEMAGTRLQNRRMRRGMISATIKHDIIQDIEAGNNPLDFIRRMRRIHKIGWINTRIGNIILNQVCKRHSLPAGLALLEPLLREGFRPNIITLRTPLFLACSYHSPAKVAEVLKLFASNHNIHPDPACYDKLWHLAWLRRHLNVSALIFVAACMNGAVTTKMRNMILLSVRINNDRLRLRARKYLAYRPTSATPSNEILNKYSPLQPRATIEQPSWSTLVYICLVGNFVLNLNPWQLRDPSKRLELTFIKDMIRHLARGRFKLKYSLAYHYQQAYALDAGWKIFEGQNVREKLGKPCVIELELKGGEAGKAREANLGGEGVNYYVRTKPWAGPEKTDKAYWLGPRWA